MFFFFTGNNGIFWKTQSNIYDGTFLQKKDNGKNWLTIFAKKLHHRLLVGFEIELLAILSKNSHLKDIPSYAILFCVFILIMHILFSRTNQKNVLQKKIRLNRWSLRINWAIQSLIPADWIIENDLCQILCLVLDFLVKRRGFALFFMACLAQTQ